MSFFILGCSTQNNLELEIITKEINCKDVKFQDYPQYMKMDTVAIEESRTLLMYKLTNNTNKTYYFNLDDFDDDFKYKFIKIKEGHISIYDDNGTYQKPRISSPSDENKSEMLYIEYLNKSDNSLEHDNSNNFFIHPGESLYFEWFIVLPFGNLLEDINYSVVLDSKKKYFAEIMMHSDSTGYKNSISRADLKTIQENKYEVFNGTIKSKNKIPIIFK